MALNYIGVTQGADAKILVDNIGGTGYPVSKMMLGAEGSVDGLVNKNNPVPMEISDGPIYDAFGRIRTSDPLTLFENKFLHDKQSLLWDEYVVNNSGASSSHNPTNASVEMFVNANDTVIRQTKQRFNYQAGKSHLIFSTFLLGEKNANVTKRVGYFDQDNGIFLEQDGTNLKFVTRKSGIDTAVNQSGWNLDTFNGSGNSNITIDESNAQIMIIDFEWLGVGRVRTGFVVGGNIFYCHEFLHSNQVDSVYMSTPNNPLRYEIVSTGGSGQLDQICSTVISEGGREEDRLGISRSFSNDTLKIDANLPNSGYAIVGMRLKDTHLDSTVIPVSVDMFSITNDNFHWKLCLNPVLQTGITYSGLDNSAIEAGVGSSSHIVDDYGTVINQGYFVQKGGANIDFNDSLSLGSSITGLVDELVLVAVPFTSNADVVGSISWRE